MSAHGIVVIVYLWICVFHDSMANSIIDYRVRVHSLVSSGVLYALYGCVLFKKVNQAREPKRLPQNFKI